MADHQQGTRPGRIPLKRSNLKRPAAVSNISSKGVGPSKRLKRDATSPSDSVAPAAVNATGSAKSRDFEPCGGSQQTFINVVVRCRGRNEREVLANSNVVVTTEGVKGSLVGLSMGSNALNNKTYNFDQAFSPAADQTMIFDNVVKPILDEMLAGYNCTIFAYGQTGTGKTYTMSGDITDYGALGLLSDAAGIIPRALHALFKRLKADSTESCVRVSFIELYNEELRDLISTEETAKLKIYDDTSRKGHTRAVVQGMEEKHIETAADGISVLQEGSLKRQVAATNCNDLSSRSHTIFTITAYSRRTLSDGTDELVQAGKLNLVDLAGSENIQRSGAENKRATEAGLINKSLLTLGRVINALVDRSPHIPYRESKLTRLLQDSLGGQTKTCIIATVSPTKDSLDETMSTLDYAFRAKNIQNKPQLNQPIDKRTLLKDFANEIDRLRSELVHQRRRDGVHLSTQGYEEITTASESRRIVLEEQSAKLEMLEKNLRNKVQDLLALSASFMELRKDNDGTKMQLDEKLGLLENAELVLAATRNTLAEETQVRKAHQRTEKSLVDVGKELVSNLGKANADVDGLHAKIKRKSELHANNRMAWCATQGQVSEITSIVEQSALDLCNAQSRHLCKISSRMGDFVQGEVARLSSAQALLNQQLSVLGDTKRDLLEQGKSSAFDVNKLLGDADAIRDGVTKRAVQNLRAVPAAVEKSAADILGKLGTFQSQLHDSYNTLDKDVSSISGELTSHLAAQRSESEGLRRQFHSAAQAMVERNEAISQQIQETMREEKQQARQDRQQLLAQISDLVEAQGKAQELRIEEKAALLQKGVLDSNMAIEESVTQYDDAMEAWNRKEGRLLEDARQSTKALELRLRCDLNAANMHCELLGAATKDIYPDTASMVDERVADLDRQMQALYRAIDLVRSEVAQHCTTNANMVHAASVTVEKSYDTISQRLKNTLESTKTVGEEIDDEAQKGKENIGMVAEELCVPLAELRHDVGQSTLRDYEPTGDTPAKVRYPIPTELPQTECHDAIISGMHGNPDRSPSKATRRISVFPDSVGGGQSTIAVARQSSGWSTHASSPLDEVSQEAKPNISTVSKLDVTANITPLLPLENNTMAAKAKNRSAASGKKVVNAAQEGSENMEGSFSVGTAPGRRRSARLG